MASNVTSVYSVGVRLGVDSTDFASGTAQAEAAMTDLATTTQTAAQDIDTSLTTDVPASVDSSAVSVTTKASKFKAVGTELGQSLVGGISSGSSGPEAVAGLGNSLSGLAAATASTGAGALAAVGLGLGAALFGKMIQASAEAKQQIKADVASWTSAYVDGLGRIDKAIRSSLIEGAFQDADSALNRIREKYGDVAEENINQVGKALYGTPSDQQAAIEYLERQERILSDQYKTAQQNGNLSSEELAALALNVSKHFDLIQALKDENGLRADGKTEAEKILGVLRTTNSLTKEQKQAMEGVHDATRGAADEANRYADGLERANSAAANLNRGNGNLDDVQ